MVCTIDQKNNHMIVFYENNEQFNENILVDLEAKFKVLDPTKILTIEINAFAPFEVMSYIVEVSQYCDMYIFTEAEHVKKFMDELATYKHITCNIKIKDNK